MCAAQLAGCGCVRSILVIGMVGLLPPGRLRRGMEAGPFVLAVRGTWVLALAVGLVVARVGPWMLVRRTRLPLGVMTGARRGVRRAGGLCCVLGRAVLADVGMASMLGEGGRHDSVLPDLWAGVPPVWPLGLVLALHQEVL